MANSSKYFVVKDRNDLSITYLEYDKVQGYDLQPRNVKIKDAIDVNRMIIINPSMIEKLAFKKVENKFKRLTKIFIYVLSLSDESEDSGEAYHEALNEISKLRLELYVHYQNKLNKSAFVDFCKRLDILEKELQLRLYYNLELSDVNERSIDGKSR